MHECTEIVGLCAKFRLRLSNHHAAQYATLLTPQIASYRIAQSKHYIEP